MAVNIKREWLRALISYGCYHCRGAGNFYWFKKDKHNWATCQHCNGLGCLDAIGTGVI